MNVEIGTETPIFLSWEYLFQIFGILSLQCRFGLLVQGCWAAEGSQYDWQRLWRAWWSVNLSSRRPIPWVLVSAVAHAAAAAVKGLHHTYVEDRAVSCVFQNIDPQSPSPPSECVLLPHPRRGGVHTHRGRWGGGGSIFGRRQSDIGLASYSIIPLRVTPTAPMAGPAQGCV